MGLLTLVLLFSPLLLGNPLAQELPVNMQDNLVRIDFENVDIQAMVRFISKITGKNFIIDDNVRGRVSIVTPDRVSVEQAYQIFLSVLNLKGYTAVQAGPAIKIIPTKDARNVPLPLVTPGYKTPEGELFVTDVIQLHYVDSQDLAGLLQNMMSQDGLIAAYPTTNSIILIDTAANISRLKKLAKEFDIPESFQKIMIIPLEYASCTDMADKILALFGEGYGAVARRLMSRGRRGATPQQLSVGMLKVIPDERTNSLIIMADPSQASQIREVVKQLDIETPSTYGNMYVYYLKNADAEEVAKVLQELARTELSEQGTAQGGQALTREAQLGIVTGQFQGPVKIAADKGTNSIIVFASQQDYRMIETVLRKLDIRRNQVFVQALIAALSVNASRDLGVWIKGGGQVGNNAVGGQTLPGGGPGTMQGQMGTAPSQGAMLPSQGGLGPLPSQGQGAGQSVPQAGIEALSSTFMNPFALPGFAATAISGGTVNIGGQQIPLWQAVIQAVASDSRSDLLSTPYLLAMDNQEAEINVGQEVPMLSGQFSSIEAPDAISSTIERQPVGIILKITPKISEGKLIQLEIYQEVSAVDRTAAYTNQYGFTTNKRTAKTMAVVKDNSTIIIGGLIDTNVSKTISKVPILGSIPILGYLFKTEGTQTTKQNLIILLTPHIIRTPSDIDRYRLEQELIFEEFKRRNKIHLRPERLGEGNY